MLFLGRKTSKKSLLLPPVPARLMGRVPALLLAGQELQRTVIAKGMQPSARNIAGWELVLMLKG